LTSAEDGVVGVLYAISNGDRKVYGDISGEASQTYTFTDQIRMQGLSGFTENNNIEDPDNIIYGDIENISVISFQTDDSICHELHEHEEEIVVVPTVTEESKLAVHWIILIVVASTLLLVVLLCLLCAGLGCHCLYKAKKHYSTHDGDVTRRGLIDDLEMQSCANMTNEEYCEYLIRQMITRAVVQVQNERESIITPGLD